MSWEGRGDRRRGDGGGRGPERGLVDFRENLRRTRLAPDLLATLDGPARGLAFSSEAAPAPYDVIIEVNSDFPGGAASARLHVLRLLHAAGLMGGDQVIAIMPALRPAGEGPTEALPDWPELPVGEPGRVDVWKSLHTETYLFAELTASTLEALGAPGPGTRPNPIHKVWRDHPLEAFVHRSTRTVKCDAAISAFGTGGEGIVWAIADTGIDGRHPHFSRHRNLELPHGLMHRDFTGAHSDDARAAIGALVDDAGHGTHVAGIIAGETLVGAGAGSRADDARVDRIVVDRALGGVDGAGVREDDDLLRISGLAPRCSLISLKVLRDEHTGRTSDLMAAIGYIRQANGSGGNPKIHGLNLSVGYDFEAEWFAVGQSPLCAEVDRLVRSGVVVVAAAGNSGYGRVMTHRASLDTAALLCTIADPGNSALAITVGSTHRDRPHAYGVSYFSAKGPTADGRQKPDLVAPGERIVSCAAVDAGAGTASFREESGTSMSAAHVSGAIAGFLSVRREFIERPGEVKAIFASAATDLGRRPEFQGGGLLDAMRALQSR